MKVFKITGKNLKLLMRSKTSMFVIIFGPLLIMLLVGFAFNNPSSSKLNVGYVPQENTTLTQSFVSALRANNNFQLVKYDDAESCKRMIEQAKIHICIIFPQDFNIADNKTNEIVFYVDQSRANFVYAIIDTVSSKVNLQSSQLSYQMTNDLLGVISNTQASNNENLAKIIALKASLTDMSAKLSSAGSRLASLDLNSVSVNTADMTAWTNSIQRDVTTLKTKGTDVVDRGDKLVTDLSGQTTANGSAIVSAFDSDLTTYNGNILNATNKTQEDILLLLDVIDTVSADVAKINLKLSTAKTTTADSSTQLTQAVESLNAAKTELDSLKASIEKVNSQINALKVTSAESIVNPIRTTVTPISTKANNLNFVFPYLIILIIAFISIMLSSTIIIMEKTSKAYFRNFTTPTKDFTFIISVFLTSFFVVVAQLVFILLLAYYFLNTTILTNIWMTLLLIVLSITLFTLLGMIIGYLFNSQEAVTMASISLGSVFLFLSNLILPLESMSALIQEAARYNPYVMASELLKKITLFSSEWSAVQSEFILIALYIMGALILAYSIEKISKIQYISKRPITKQLRRKEEIIDKYFKLNSGVLLRNEKELLAELNRMSDITFKEYVDDKKNDFESWLLMNGKNDLAKAIGKSRNRKEMVDVINKYSEDSKKG